MPITLNEQVKILVELQKIDAEIYQLRKELSEYPALLKEIQAAFEKKKVNFKAAEDELKVLQLKQKEKEMELQTKEEKVKKLQGQLYQLKTNKEYSVMDLEIKGLKADNSLLEEEILKLLDAVDQAKAKAAKEKELVAAEEKKLKEEDEVLKKKVSQMNAEVTVLEEKRKSYTPNIDPKLYYQYEKILKGREGIAIVPVKNNSCSGCFMELTSQTVNEVQMQEKLIFCESCARILYWFP